MLRVSGLSPGQFKALQPDKIPRPAPPKALKTPNPCIQTCAPRLDYYLLKSPQKNITQDKITIPTWPLEERIVSHFFLAGVRQQIVVEGAELVRSCCVGGVADAATCFILDFNMNINIK